MSKKKKLIPELRFHEFKNSSEWEVFKLGEILLKNSTKNRKLKYSLVQSVSNKYGFINQDEYFENRIIASKDTSNYYVIKKGYFAYNPSRIDVGSLAYKHDNETSIISPLYVSFRSNNEKALDIFLLNWFLSENFKKQMIFEGGVRNTLNYENLSEIKITLPSIKEQQKIASFLSNLDCLIEAEKQKLELLKDHKKGLMQNFFPKEGEKVPKFRFKEFEKNGDWVVKKLGDVCKMQAGKFVSASEIKEQFDKGLYPCYGGNGLRGYINSYSHSGTYSLIGRQGALCGNVTLANGDFHATEHAIVVYPESGVNTIWLFYILEFLNLNRFATGQAQPGLSVNNLEQVELTITENLKEQLKIASCLSSLDKIIDTQNNKIEHLKLYKKGLMQSIFPIV